MNAPFRPGVRDAFHAYVNDDHNLATLRSIVGELGWSVEKVFKGGLRTAIQSLSVMPSPNVLFVDISESGDPLTDINGLAEVCEPGTVVLVSGHMNDVRLYRDLLSSGIQDYLLKPFAPDHLRDALSAAQAVFHTPRDTDGSLRTHYIYTVIGARGGVGASMVATSLAQASAARQTGTALLDLDVHFGTGALAMDLEPGRGLIDAVENPGRIDGLFIERAIVRASEHLAVLSAEAPISQPIFTDGSAFHMLHEELRASFERTVVDMPRATLLQHPHLVQSAKVVVLVAELSLASARDTIRLLSWLRTNASQSAVLVVANKVQPAALEISRKDFEQSIERSVDLLLPYDAKTACQASKLGRTVSDSGKATKLGQGIIQLLEQIETLADDGEDDIPAHTKAAKRDASLLKRMLSGLAARSASGTKAKAAPQGASVPG
jgi:pilus assembly protein CpaE